MNTARMSLLTATIVLAISSTLLTLNVLMAGDIAISRLFLAVSVAAAAAIPVCVSFDDRPSDEAGCRNVGRRNQVKAANDPAEDPGRFRSAA